MPRKNNKHITLVCEAKEAITAVFSDTTVPRSETRESLIDIRDEIDMLLETLR